MKIAHVLPALTKGGGERVAAELANHAIQAGHEVTMIAARPVDSAQLRGTLHPDIRVLYIANARVFRLMNYFYLLPWLFQNRTWISELDILHCHLTFGAVFGTLVRVWRAISKSKKPTIIETYHSVGGPMPIFHRWLRAQMAARFDALALIAKDDYWDAFTRKHTRVLSRIILNGISDPGPIQDREQLRNAYRSELGIPDNCRLVVGTVGRLSTDRKPWLYLPIFTQIAREFGADVHFLLAGDGSEYERIRLLVKQNGLEGQIHLPGLILDPRGPMSAIDLYLTLNVGPVTGLAGLEAAYLGLPIVAIQLLDNYRSTPEDWIWSSTDLSEIGDRAICLLRAPENRQALVEKQSVFVRAHHSIEAMAQSYYEFYQSAIEHRYRTTISV